MTQSHRPYHDAITRRRFLQDSTAPAAALGIGAAAARGDAADEAGKQGRRPNLVFVLADQLRYSSCGYAGDERAETPNIDRLAGGGCNFKNAVSMTPVCSAYRASLFTGKHTTSTGMVINELRLSPEHECFGHVLTRAGYRTGYVGKWHLWANQLGHHHEDRNGFVPPGPYRLGFDGDWAAYNFHHNYYGAFYYKDELADDFRPCTWYRDHWTADRNILRGAKGGTHDLEALERIVRKCFPVEA